MVSSMTIKDVINPSCINLHMKGKDKKSIIEEMADMFHKAGVLNDRNGFINAVYEREKEGPTGIGDQVAIPHGKTSAVRKTSMAVGRVDHGVPWESLGDGDTNDNDTSELVSLLSQVAVALCDKSVIETLLTTENTAEIYSLFNRKEEL